MELLHKALVFEVKEVGQPEDRTLEFIGNSGQVDRYGDIIEVEGWDLKNFKKNSPFLWAHNYGSPPVGKVVSAIKDPRGLICRTYFMTDNECNAAGWPANIPTPETVYRLYKAGFLKAVSVGFQGIEREPILGKADEQGAKPQTGWRYTKQDLYELSAVPVPADPGAVMLAVQKGVISAEQAQAFQPIEAKGVIPYKEYPPDDPAASWDGPKEMAACADQKAMQTVCTWFDSAAADPDGDGLPDAKSAYKLPHHRGNGFKVVWMGVSAAMAALLGSRGGVNIPDTDRKGVYNHLAKHYAQFGKTPPEFKEYGEPDLVRITLGAEPNGFGFDDLFLSGLLKSQELEPLQITKAGAVLSAKNKTALKNAQAMIQQVLDAAEPAPGAEGKAAIPKPSIYSLASNSGDEPHGERQAGEAEKADKETINQLTQNFTQGLPEAWVK